jgi:thiamine pyrophosphokinase
LTNEKYILLLLDGEEPSKEFVQKFAEGNSLVIATDGAAKYAHVYEIHPDIIIGDMDSITKDLRQFYTERGTRIIEDPDQQTNDFEKALKYILAEALSKEVIVLGIHGKRTDHLLTNFSVMLRFTDKFDSLIAYDATHEHHFLTAEKHWYSFTAPVGSVVSLTPLPAAQGITTSGLYYPLKNERMLYGEREGLGNIITEEHATVEIMKGSLLISVPI